MLGRNPRPDTWAPQHRVIHPEPGELRKSAGWNAITRWYFGPGIGGEGLKEASETFARPGNGGRTTASGKDYASDSNEQIRNWHLIDTSITIGSFLCEKNSSCQYPWQDLSRQ